MTDPERKTVSTARAELYSFLATLLMSEVTGEVLDAVRRPEAIAALKPFGADFWGELDAMERDLGRDRLIEELACEFARLFIGPGPHIYPYESLHREDSKERVLWGPAASEVKRFIEAHGLSLGEGSGGIPDHIAIELDFMARVSREEAQALEAGDEERADAARESRLTFFRDHVGRWVPSFCAQVEEQARSALYRDVARILRTMVEVEQEELEASSSGTREDRTDRRSRP